MRLNLGDKKEQVVQDKVQQKDHNGQAVELFFAPKPRDFSKKVNKQAKRTALLSALSAKLADKEITVLDKFEIASAKTKDAQKFLDAFNFKGNVLVVNAGNSANELKAVANIPTLDTVNVELLNVYDVVASKNVVLTESAIKYLEEANA